MTEPTHTRFRRGIGAAVLIAAASLSSPAWACRGEHAFPAALEALASAPASEETKAGLQSRLEQGGALHDRAHAQGDEGLMRQSLDILDGVCAELPSICR